VQPAAPAGMQASIALGVVKIKRGSVDITELTLG
jgi:hypothetical protein